MHFHTLLAPMKAVLAVAVAAVLVALAQAAAIDKLKVLAERFKDLDIPKVHPIVRDRLWQMLDSKKVSKEKEDIVGGYEVDPEFKYEFMASLQYTTGGHFCGGSLLNSTVILTAAHCSVGMNPRSLTVHLHRHQLSRTVAAENGITRSVSSIVVHPEYRSLTTDNDVALWVLSSPVTDLDPVLIDESCQYTTPGTNQFVIGWGALSQGGRAADSLQEVVVPITTDAACDAAYPRAITDNMVCAGFANGGKDSCQGDSGGPLFVTSTSGKSVQTGVVSWGSGCAQPNAYGVYARLCSSSILSWISSEVN